MPETDQHLVAFKMTSTIKLIGVLIAAVHEQLWGLDDDDNPALPNLLAALQVLGRSLSALRTFATDDADLVVSVLMRLSGPVDECAAELDGLRGRIADGGLSGKIEKGLVFASIEQLKRPQGVFDLALRILQDHWKWSKVVGGFDIQDSDSEEVELDNPVFQCAAVLEKRKKHLSWLYAADYDGGLHGVEERSVPGTGEWILQSPIVQNWLKGLKGFVNLCGSGIAGAGKTHISAKIIQHIQTTPKSNNAVAYFFFQHMQTTEKHPTDVLRCLTLQLACQAPNFVSVSRILHHRLIAEQPPPSFEKLTRALIDTSKLFDHVFLVLHGLDEYEHGTDLVPLFRALSTANIGVFVTTGPSGLGKEYSLLAAAKLELAARAEDIEAYIRYKIEESPNAKHLLAQRANREKFVTGLTGYADGRFLYVHLAMRSLLQQPTVAHIFNELQKLQASPPPDKDRHRTVFDLVVARIRALPPSHAALAFKILLWAAKAAHPLPLSALRDAIAITDDAPGELDSSDTHTMLTVCEGLITLDAPSGRVRLVHPYAHEYLLPILTADAHYRVARACTTYLSHRLFTTPADPTRAPGHRSIEERLHTYPFYAYATKHLVQHIAECEASSTTELLLSFVRRSGALISYFQSHDQTFRDNGLASLSLRMAIHLGHLPVVMHLLDNDGIDPFAPDQNHHTAFHWAAAADRREIVQLLMERWQKFVWSSQDHDREQAELWYTDMYGRSVLHVAARNGFTELVKIFLPHEDLEDTYGGRPTPLHEAVLGGHERVIQLILERGVDPTAVDGIGQTALHVAAAAGNLGIVGQLLGCRRFRWQGGHQKKDERFDVGTKDRTGRTPLHLAAHAGHTSVVQLLLNQSASCWILDRTGESVLLQAVSSGDALSVRMILDHGAPVSTKLYSGVTPLHRAATYGYTDIIAILLNHGAGFSKLVDGNSVLELALAGGHEAAVQLLRLKGAEPALPANVDRMLIEPAKDGDTGLVKLLLSHGGNPSGKPLIAAAAAGRQNVVALLLDGGADTAVQDELGWTALHHAADSDHLRIVSLLAGQGAARNLQDQTAMVLAAGKGHEAIVRALLPDLHDGGAAMTADIHAAFFLAARNGHHAVASLLVTRGASVQTTDKDGRTAFVSAVEDGHSKVVELLLRFGVDVSERSKAGESALFVASRRGNVDIVRMLLAHGASLTETNAEGQTALFVAGKNNHREVYGLLVEKGINQFIRDRDGKMATIEGGDDGPDEGGDADYLPRVVG